MKVVIQPVNPGFKSYVLQYVAEVEKPRYTLVGTEGPGNTTYVFECDEENLWLAVDGLRRPSGAHLSPTRTSIPGHSAGRSQGKPLGQKGILPS